MCEYPITDTSSILTDGELSMIKLDKSRTGRPQFVIHAERRGQSLLQSRSVTHHCHRHHQPEVINSGKPKPT